MVKEFDLLREGKTREGVALIYERHYSKIYGAAFLIVKEESTCQDIVHNVIYKLLMMEKEKFPTARELTWLYTVTKNEALSFLRKETGKISVESIPAPLVEDKNINDFVNMDGYYSMIKGLNEVQREVVTLKVLGGYTHREIAEILKKPVGTVQWIYNTSVKKLKITLSSILTTVLLSVIGFAARLFRYLFIGQDNSNMEGGMSPLPPDSPTPTPQPSVSFDYFIVIFGIIAILGTLVLILLYKNSHKIPTKADRKNI